MRWTAFAVVAVIVLGLQMSVGAAIRIPLGTLALAIDLPAVLVLLVALRTRDGADAALAGWAVGFAIDLAVTGVPLGLHAICYAMAAAAMYQTRSTVFTESVLTQGLLALVFCLIAHGASRLFVNLYVRPDAAWLWRDMLQAAMIAVSTAAVAPVGLALGRRMDWVMILQPSWRRR